MDFFLSKTTRVLNVIQKYTKVDMRYLATSGFWLGSQQVITVVASFALSVVMANFVSKTDYGTYRFFLSIFAVFLVFSLPGISVATITGVANKSISRVWAMFGSQVRWGLIGACIALGVSAYYFIQGNNTLGTIFLLAVPFIPFFDSFLVYESWLRGEKKFKTIAVYRSTTQILFTALFAIFVILFPENVVYLIAVYLLLFIALRYFFFVKTFGVKNFFSQAFRAKADTQEKGLMVYGKHLSVMNAFTFVALALDKVIVFHFLGASTLAVYAFALALPEQIKAGVKQLISVALPKYAERTYEGIKKTVLFRLGMVMGLVFVMSLIYIMCAPFVFNIFFPQYGDSIIYTQILGLVLAPNAGIFFLRTIFNAQKRTKEQYVFSVVYPVTQIFLFMAGYFLYGLLGVVIAQVVSQVFGLFLMLFLLFRFS